MCTAVPMQDWRDICSLCNWTTVFCKTGEDKRGYGAPVERPSSKEQPTVVCSFGFHVKYKTTL